MVDQPISVNVEEKSGSGLRLGRVFLVLALIFLLAAAGATGWRYYQNYQVKLYIVDKVNEIYSAMTLEERVGQLFMLALPGKKYSPAVEKELARIKPGSIIYFGYNFDLSALQMVWPNTAAADQKQINAAARRLKSFNSKVQAFMTGRHKLPLLICTDQEGGRVVRIGAGVTQLPGALGLGQTQIPKLSQNAGFINGVELRRLGLNFNLTPVLDINNNPANPVINTRSFGSDLETVENMALAYMRGQREAGIVPAVKHFPGHGDTSVDSHIALPVIRKSEGQLEDLELKPFRKAIADGAEVVMTAHILLPKIDKKRVVTLSPVFLKKILRDKLKFNGVIISDALEMEGVRKRNPGEDLSAKAIKAGVDILLWTSWGKGVWKSYDHLIDEVKAGRISAERLEQSVKRILTLKLKKGIFHRNGSAYVRPDDRLGAYLQDNDARIEAAFNDLHKNLPAVAETSDWSEIIHRASVRSLRKDIRDVPLKPERAVFYYRSELMKNTARFYGMAVRPLGQFFDDLNTKQSKEPKKAYLAELYSPADVAKWNAAWRGLRKARKWKQSGSIVENTNGAVYALYGSIPFVKMLVPGHGGVVATFAPVKTGMVEGLKRLIYAGQPAGDDELGAVPQGRTALPAQWQPAFYGPIPKARLILP